jgi:hypothetical protein
LVSSHSTGNKIHVLVFVARVAGNIQSPNAELLCLRRGLSVVITILHVSLDQYYSALTCPFGLSLFFFNLHRGGWSPYWVHSARRPLTGLLYLPRVIVRMENLVE